MKVKVIRSSGHPIELEDIEAYKQEWRELYDKAQDRYTVGRAATGDRAVDTLGLSKLLDRCERILQAKYNRIAEWDFLDTPEKLLEKMEQHGNLMITRRADNQELLYVILDEDLIQNA